MLYNIIILEPYIICNIILISNPKSKNMKINKNENKLSPLFSILTFYIKEY